MTKPTASTLSRPGLWFSWVALLSEREPGTSLALFRIACGLCILYSVGSVVVQGMVPVLWLSPSDGGFESLGPAPRLFRLLGGVRPETVWPVVVLSLVSGFLLIAG